jgi:ribonuclease Z
MEIVFLGTSSALPTINRNHSSFALKAFGEVFLFDCGEATQRQMTFIKLSPMKVNHIFITHLHGDHFLGLPGMIQSMAFRGRINPLHIYGPIGIEKTIYHILNMGYFTIKFEIIAHELSKGTVLEEDNYQITCAPARHSVQNLSYCVEEKRSPRFIREKALKLGLRPGPDYSKLQRGLPVKLGDRIIEPYEVLGEERKGIKIVYSGDTIPCEEIIDFSRDADILIHDSTFDGANELKALKTGHSTSISAARIAKAANVKKLILTHLSTRYRDEKLLEKEAKAIFPHVIVAEDFMKLEVKRNGD